MQACKPGSVSLAVARGLTIYLAPASLPGSIDLPIRLIPLDLPYACVDSLTWGRSLCQSIACKRKVEGPIGRATLFTNATVGESRTYLVFQPVRFSLPLMSPLTRWALTPPFHPYHNARRYGGIFSVALSVSGPQAGTFLLGSTVLYVARTFLPDPNGQSGKTACNSCKFINIDDNEKLEALKKNDL